MAPTKPLLHNYTEKLLTDLLKAPPHALLLCGPSGIGKGSVVRWLAAEILRIPEDGLINHPYILWLSADSKKLGIDDVRAIEKFISLKVPGHSAINRLIIIENSQSLSIEAQNALLKTLEEPPVGTMILLTASGEETLLPTVRSRLTKVVIKTPPTDKLNSLLESKYPKERIEQAALVSGGLPGLMTAILTDEQHPLMPAISQARGLLGGSTYNRLLCVEMLAKDKQLTENTLLIMQQMSEVQLLKPDEKHSVRWGRILELSYNADLAIKNSGQTKLVLTDLLLNLG